MSNIRTFVLRIDLSRRENFERKIMKKYLIAVCSVAVILVTSGCVVSDGQRRGGVYQQDNVQYDGYYDGYYGLIRAVIGEVTGSSIIRIAIASTAATIQGIFAGNSSTADKASGAMTEVVRIRAIITAGNMTTIATTSTAGITSFADR